MNEKAANSDAFTHGGSVVGNTSAESPTDLSKAPQSDELINRIKESADKLARDGSSRGDLKIVSRALRELRYAFKVFSPYRNQRKVSVFGSADWCRQWHHGSWPPGCWAFAFDGA